MKDGREPGGGSEWDDRSVVEIIVLKAGSAPTKEEAERCVRDALSLGPVQQLRVDERGDVGAGGSVPPLPRVVAAEGPANLFAEDGGANLPGDIIKESRVRLRGSDAGKWQARITKIASARGKYVVVWVMGNPCP